MATLTIELGRVHAEYLRSVGCLPVVNVTIGASEEFDLEAVFVAANRIATTSVDCRALKAAWQRELRWALDNEKLPSMSVGDRVTLISDLGIVLGIWECAPSGWSTIDTSSTLG